MTYKQAVEVAKQVLIRFGIECFPELPAGVIYCQEAHDSELWLVRKDQLLNQLDPRD